jgi:hypothetical protein
MRTKLITIIAAFVFSWNAFAQEETCQTLNFPAGWSMFSTYIEPPFPNYPADYLLNTIAGSIIISKSETGAAYIPGWPWIPHNINNEEGYQIKMSNADSITICGPKLSPELYPITISEGWNFISYLRDTPQDATEALSDIDEEIIIVKDSQGAVYMPNLNYNGIGDLEPGKGYQIKMNSEQTLIYDANED